MTVFRFPAVLGLLPLFAGCAEPPVVSSVCEEMCTTATQLYGSCLDTWGVDWTSAGFDNAKAHQESCEVWSWQTSEIHGADTIDAICEDRGALLNEGECSDYSAIDWNAVP